MVISHNLGFPRIGAKRELKFAVERYWKGEINRDILELEGKKIRLDNWTKQINANHDFLSVGDFSWYDHVLDMSVLLGVIPDRFKSKDKNIDIDTYFRMARGRAPSGEDVHACEMTKWFDTNYHYIVPEFEANQCFSINSDKLFSEIREAQTLGRSVKPIILGPISYLWLGKTRENNIDKLTLLENIQQAYIHILEKIKSLGVEWVQIDEPILALDLPLAWQQAITNTYQKLNIDKLNILLASYFGGLNKNTELAGKLPTAGLHIDLIRSPEQAASILSYLPENKILSIGVVDGRNIWKTDLRKVLNFIRPLHAQLNDRLWISSSCSLLHCPVDLDLETQLDSEFKSWLSFSTQKLHEINIIARGLNDGENSISAILNEHDKAIATRKTSTRIHDVSVKKRCDNVTQEMTLRNNPFAIRQQAQQNQLKLPFFPTTTIGSFPQTQIIREIRHNYKLGKIDNESYRRYICDHISKVIYKQLELGIDVIVHGEAERNDMVEYFGELLNGVGFTENGWVQSYGSRCVKPPIIFGDVSRPAPMTVDWISYAQSLTDKPVKGMLTGPTTILCWSFVRDDQPRFTTAKQIALALRDEVSDLVKAGIKVIQIDEPAFREGLPLREIDWNDYLTQSVDCFRLASSGVSDEVQIHTHMCYSEFNDVIKSIADLDADVITIETSRSNMELLDAFEKFNYPNEIGPGVYDIHSPRIPTVDEIVHLIDKAVRYIAIEKLWINPDCGLKTRDWKETELALNNMVTAAKLLREKYKKEISASKKSESALA